MSYKGWFYICVYMSYTGFGVIHLKKCQPKFVGHCCCNIVFLNKTFRTKKNPVKLITGFG